MCKYEKKTRHKIIIHNMSLTNKMLRFSKYYKVENCWETCQYIYFNIIKFFPRSGGNLIDLCTYTLLWYLDWENLRRLKEITNNNYCNAKSPQNIAKRSRKMQRSTQHAHCAAVKNSNEISQNSPTPKTCSTRCTSGDYRQNSYVYKANVIGTGCYVSCFS